MQCEKCGAACDKKGVCTACQTQNHRSKGYVVGHSILCVLFILILLGNVLSTGLTRMILGGGLREEMEETDFATMPVGAMMDQDDLSMTLSEYIYENYVTESVVQLEDVENVIRELDINQLLLDKMDNYQAFLEGDEKVLQTLEAKEIIQLIDDNEDVLLKELGMIISDADKLELADQLREPLDEYNDTMQSAYGGTVRRMGAVIKYSWVTFWIEIAAILCLLVRWCIVFCHGRGRAGHGVRGFGITLIVPTAPFLLGGIACKLCDTFLPSGYDAIASICGAVARPMLIVGGVGVLGGIVLLCLANIMLAVTAPKALVPAAGDAVDASPIMAEVPTPPQPEAPAEVAPETIPVPAGNVPEETPVETPEEPAIPVAPQEAPLAADPAPAPEAPASSAPVCLACGAEIRDPATQKFCMKCGQKL